VASAYPDELPAGGSGQAVVRVTAPDGEYVASAARAGGSMLEPPGGPEDFLRALSVLRGEPSFEAVLDAAVSYAGLDPGAEERIASDAAWAALLPDVRFTVRRSWERDQSLDLAHDARDDYGIDTDDDLSFTVSAQWDLADLVAPPTAVAARRLALDAESSRRALRLQVAQLHFERLRLRLQWASVPPDDVSARADIAFAIAERTARLDALTGGWFSAVLGRGGETESDP
jgi:hypothetical protein